MNSSESPIKGTPSPKIVAVIPAFNEERFIASVILMCQAYVDTIIVISDGSTDRTAAVARASGATVYEHAQNLGKAKALQLGFSHAQALEPNVIITLDGDAQHEPDDIPQLVQPILAGEADIVIGSRFLNIENKSPRWRQTGQHLLNIFTALLSGQSLTDSQSGFRAFSPAALSSMMLQSKGLAAESEMQFEFARLGLKIAEVPVRMYYQDKNKRNPVMHGVEIVDVLLSLVARRRPLLFLALPGFLISLVGILLGFRVISIFQAAKEIPLGTAFLMAIFLLGGLMLSVTGVILNSLSAFVHQIREDLKAQRYFLESRQ